MMKLPSVPGVHDPIGRYVHAIVHDGLIYVSGCGPFDTDGRLVGTGDVAAQCRQTLSNARRILERAGSSPARVLKETVYLTDIESRFATRVERERFYGAHMPASTLNGPHFQGAVIALSVAGRVVAPGIQEQTFRARCREVKAKVRIRRQRR